MELIATINGYLSVHVSFCSNVYVYELVLMFGRLFLVTVYVAT